MRASRTILAFGLLVASAATVTATHSNDANGDPAVHTNSGVMTTEPSASPLQFDISAVTPSSVFSDAHDSAGRTPSASRRAQTVSTPDSRSARGFSSAEMSQRRVRLDAVSPDRLLLFWVRERERELRSFLK